MLYTVENILRLHIVHNDLSSGNINILGFVFDKVQKNIAEIAVQVNLHTYIYNMGTFK